MIFWHWQPIRQNFTFSFGKILEFRSAIFRIYIRQDLEKGIFHEFRIEKQKKFMPATTYIN